MRDPICPRPIKPIFFGGAEFEVLWWRLAIMTTGPGVRSPKKGAVLHTKKEEVMSRNRRRLAGPDQEQCILRLSCKNMLALVLLVMPAGDPVLYVWGVGLGVSVGLEEKRLSR
jgi:hypothetical protein